MKLSLYDENPWRLFHDMDKDLGNFWGWPVEKNKHNFPACDFHEDKDHFFMSFDLPGLKKEDITINYENRLLTVSGTRKEEYQNEKSRFMEKFYGSFNRSFTLPSSIDEEKISAHFENGVLELVLSKTQKSKGREIPVQEGKRKFFSNPLKKSAG